MRRRGPPRHHLGPDARGARAPDDPDHRGAHRQELAEGARQAQAAALTRALAVAGDHGVTVGSEVFEGDPGMRLVQASHGARLLVVGSRSLGAVRAVLLGSVSRYVARHAECPVVVVPARHEREHDDTHEGGEPPRARPARLGLEHPHADVLTHPGVPMNPIS